MSSQNPERLDAVVASMLEQISKTLTQIKPEYFLVGITLKDRFDIRTLEYQRKTRDYLYPTLLILGDINGYPVNAALNIEKSLFNIAKSGHNFGETAYNRNKLTGSYRKSLGGKSSDPKINSNSYVIYLAATDNPAISSK